MTKNLGPALKENGNLNDLCCRFSNDYWLLIDRVLGAVQAAYRELACSEKYKGLGINALILVQFSSWEFFGSDPYQIALYSGNNDGSSPKGYDQNSKCIVFDAASISAMSKFRLKMWVDIDGDSEAGAVFANALEALTIKKTMMNLKRWSVDRPHYVEACRLNTALSILKSHEPMFFESDEELLAYGKSFGFDNDECIEILRSSNESLRAEAECCV